MKEKETDFEILREPWNKYHISDNSYVKIRYIITKFKKREPTAIDEKLGYGFEGRNLSVVYDVPEELKGEATEGKFPPEELSEGAEEQSFSIISEEWNEYVLEDGTSVRIKSNLVSILRTRKYDRNGDPIYIVNTAQLFGIKPKRF